MKWCEVREAGTWSENGQRGTKWALYVNNGYYETYLHEVTARRQAARFLREYAGAC